MNIAEIYFTLKVKLVLLPCETESVTADQIINPTIVYYAQPAQAISWEEFTQFPACEYKWHYSVYLRSEPWITTGSDPAVNLPKIELQNLTPIEPPVLVDFSSDGRKMWLTSTLIDQIDSVFDVYILGELEYGFYDPEPTDANRWAQKPMI